MIRQWIFRFFLFAVVRTYAQTSQLDSLAHSTEQMPADTNKVKAYGDLAWEQISEGQLNDAIKTSESGAQLGLKLNFYKGAATCYAYEAMAQQKKFDYAGSLVTLEKAMAAYEQSKSEAGISWTHDFMGTAYYKLGNYGKAISHSMQALQIYQKQNDTGSVASMYTTIGNIYQEQGDYSKAISFLMESMKIYEQLHDTLGIASGYLNIGIVHFREGNDSLALDYYNTALSDYRSVGSYTREASVLVNIGNVYERDSLHDDALTYYRNAREIYKATENDQRVGYCQLNIGEVYQNMHQLDSALFFYNDALELFRNAEDIGSTGSTLISLAQVKFEQGDLTSARSDAEEGLRISKESGSRDAIADGYLILSKIYAKQNDFHRAYDYHLMYSLVHDSIFNESSKKLLNEVQAKYESEKKDNEIRMLNDSTALQKAVNDNLVIDSQRQKTVRNSFIAGFILVAGLAFFIFRGYREKKKANELITAQKKEVEHQKEIIEEKNKDILDSIAYAKRLQDAILPQVAQITTRLPGSYLLYLPKDIVAGDFYFMETVGDKTIIAAADCTGHGVPGAMVSVVCSNALSRAVKEFHLTDPAVILGKVRELVMETFAKSVSEVQDGMDISLAVIDASATELLWAGANNPLWYFSHGEMKEITADKQPVGRADHAKDFTTHCVSFQKGDRIYLFTDGFADQFGGPNGKKFKYKPLKELLFSIINENPEAQNRRLQQVFLEWKGTLEQVDDVCILSVQL